MTAIGAERLNPRQEEAVAYRGGPLLVVSGAGTGKTRVITHRVAGLIAEGVPPGRILAVTFTNKAAEEMRRRVEGLSHGRGALAWIHTFHSFAARLLRQHAELLRLRRHFTIYDADDQKRLVARALVELGLDAQKNKAGLYVGVISRAKDDLLDAGSYQIHAMAGMDPFRRTAARIYTRYQEKLDQAGALDFGDLLLKVVWLLRDHEQVREHYQELFLHLLVDEYQDTNHAQYVLTKTLAARHRNVCCVGDEDQGVYSWRGANVRNILEFERDFQDAKVVRLEQNYRSTPNILSAAGLLIAHNRQRKPKTLWTERAPGESVRVVETASEGEEARWVVRAVLRLVEGGATLREIAVFYRTNAQSRQFEEAFRMARVPHRVVGAMRFYERKEVKDALAYARAALNPADSVSLARILNVPARGLGKTSQEALERHAEERGLVLMEGLEREAEVPGLAPAARKACRETVSLFARLRADLEALPPVQAMRRVLDASGYWGWLENESEADPEALARLNNLQELLNALKEFEEGRPADSSRMADFLEGVALQGGDDSRGDVASGVTLMTVHLAKGLEFPVVFLTGLEEGLLPIGAGNSSAEELEEERRLAYVGMTRAKDQLFLTHAATRRIFGRTYANLPSRFILEARLLDPEPVGMAGRPSRFRVPEAPPRSDSSLGSGLANGGQAAPMRHAVSGVKLGMRVRHPDFGPGRVVEKSGYGEALKVTVLFDGGKTRKLLLRYAPLEPA